MTKYPCARSFFSSVIPFAAVETASSFCALLNMTLAGIAVALSAVLLSLSISVLALSLLLALLVLRISLLVLRQPPLHPRAMTPQLAPAA